MYKLGIPIALVASLSTCSAEGEPIGSPRPQKNERQTRPCRSAICSPAQVSEGTVGKLQLLEYQDVVLLQEIDTRL